MPTAPGCHPCGRTPLLRLIAGCLLAVCLTAAAEARSAMEALSRGLTYPIEAVPYCTSPDALGTLVTMRQSGDLDTVPAGCTSPTDAAFAQEFRGFIPDHKVTGLSVREKLVHPNRFGRYPCPEPPGSAPATCEVRVFRAGFVAGNLVGADSSRTPAYIEVGYGIEVVDPKSGDLVFQPLTGSR